MRRRITAIAGIAIIVTGQGLFAPTAEASESAENESCFVDLDQGGQTLCFEDATDSGDYLASVVDSPDAASLTVVGTAYKNANGQGASFTFFGSNGCAGSTYGFASLASGWDNSISSIRGQNGCWVTLYGATNYGGSRLNCTPYCASVFDLNDKVKSLVFRPSGTFGR